MAIDIGIDINVDNSDAIRGIAGVKLALASLRREQTAGIRTAGLNAKQMRVQNRAIHDQTRALRGLALQWSAVRNAVLTAGIRGAITGLTAMTSAANSAATSVTALVASLGNFAGAIALGGGLGGLPAFIQSLGVAKLALDGVGKALTTTGTEHEKAMEKLIRPARKFVKEVKKMEGSFADLKILAQQGMFPGMVKGLQDAQKLLPVVRKAVWNTGQAWGYLAERAGFMAGKRGKEIDRFLQRNVRLLERGGDTTLNFSAALLDMSNSGGRMITKMSKQFRNFSKDVKDAFESKKGKNTLKGVFNNLQESWDNWTASIGAAGEAMFHVWDAIQPVVHSIEDSIENAAKKAADWAGTHKNEIRNFFYDSLGPMREFLGLVGDIGKLWVEFAQAGNDDAERIFRGLREKVLPILRDLFLYIDGNLLPSVLDFGGAFADFIKASLPGLKLLGSALGIVLDFMTGLVKVGTDIVQWADGLGKVAGLIATLGVSTAIIASWVSLKRVIGLAVLSARHFAGFAPGVPAPRRGQFADALWPVRAGRNIVHAPKTIHTRFSERREIWRENMGRGRARGKTPITDPARLLPPAGGTSYAVRGSYGTGRVIIAPRAGIKGPADSGSGTRVYPAAGKTYRSGGQPRDSLGRFAKNEGMAVAGSVMSSFLIGALMIATPIAISKISKLDFSGLKTKEAKEARSIASPTVTAPGKFAYRTSTGIRDFSRDLDSALQAGDSGRLTTLVRHIRSLGDAQKDVNKGRRMRELAEDVAAASAASTDKLLASVAPSFEEFARRGDTSINKVRDGLAVLQNHLRNKLPAGSRAYKEAMASSFSQAAGAIQQAMDSGILSAKKGMREIRRLTEEQFAILGFSKKQARNYLKNPSGDLQNKPVKPGQPVGAAVGGFWLGNKGERGRDSIPMAVNGKPVIAARGEYVGIMNASQQQAFDGMARQFGYGGMEGFFKTHSKPHHMAQGGIVQLGKQIQKMGPYTVSEHPAFGGVQGRHAPNGYHYKAGALDINADGAPGGESKWLDKLASYLGKRGWHYLWKVADHFDHLHVDVANGQLGGVGGGAAKIKRVLAEGLTDSPLKQIVQGSLDKVRGATNDALAKALGGFGVEDFGSIKGGGNVAANKRLAKRMAASMGWGGGEWSALHQLWMGESGFNHLAKNPSSGAYGIPQSLPASKMGSAGPDWLTNAATQIKWGLNYIRERYGSPSAALRAWMSRSPHWYSMGGVIPAFAGALFGPKPPDYTDPPATNPNDGKTGKTIKDEKKKKKDKEKKKKPDLAGGKPRFGQGVGLDLFKPKNKRPKKPIRKKIKKLLKQNFKNNIMQPLYDPVTGETLDPRDGFFAFQFYDKLQDWMNTQGLKLAEDQALWGRTQEEAIITLPDGTEAINQIGYTDQSGRFIPGIKQAVGEIDAELFYREGKTHPFGGGGFLGALLMQQGFMQSIKADPAIKERRQRLQKIKRAFEANVALRRSYYKKMQKMKTKNFGWREAIDHNEEIIKDWRRWLRDSYGEDNSTKRQANSEIDRLMDENDRLRKKKPRGTVYGSAEYQSMKSVFDQRGRENVLLTGSPGGEWNPNGGAAGKVLASLNAWKEVKDAKVSNLAELPTAISSERIAIADLYAAREEWTGTKLSPQTVDPSGTNERDEMLKQIGLDTLRKGSLAIAEGNTLKQFAQLLGMRYIGAFAHGGLVPETGVALVHKGETITPAPDGPYGTLSGMQTNSPIDLTVVVEDETGRILQVVDARMRQNARDVSSRQGRATRGLRAAPGRGRG